MRISVPLAAMISGFLALSAAAVEVGFGSAEITPEVGGDADKVWIAGYGMGRSATGVHDPLFARAVVLRDPEAGGKVALVSVDLVGLQRPAVQRVRVRLPGYEHVLVSSTHNHEGPDVIGIWGPNPLRSGVGPGYIEQVIEGCVNAVRAAERGLRQATARYGVAADASLLGDSRLPVVKEDQLRALRFTGEDGEAAGLVVIWNCHPEAMGPDNRELTADFPAATIAALEAEHGCPVAYFTGTVGGLLAPPDGVIRDQGGTLLKEGDWEYMKRYGEAVAALANEAIDAGEEVELTPFRIARRAVRIPVQNKLYRAGFLGGVLDRQAYVWEGAARDGARFHKVKHALRTMAIETEVGYWQLGEVGLAAIPGEIYPELVTGDFQDPADAGADFPDAPLEPTVVSLMPTERWGLIGLAADEVGYIIPRRQWDREPPYAYGRGKAQYGELNSCGPETASILLEALATAVAEARR